MGSCRYKAPFLATDTAGSTEVVRTIAVAVRGCLCGHGKACVPSHVLAFGAEVLPGRPFTACCLEGMSDDLLSMADVRCRSADEQWRAVHS